jgi:hypothetical protein
MTNRTALPDSPTPRAAAPAGLAWDSLFLWLLSWAALLLGAEWLEADARTQAPTDPASLASNQETPPEGGDPEAVRWSGVLQLPDGRPAVNVALTGWPDPVEPVTGRKSLLVGRPVYAVTDDQGRFAFEPRLEVRHSFEPQQLDLGDLRDASGAPPKWSGSGSPTWIYSPFPECWFTAVDAAGKPLERFTFDAVQLETRLHSFANSSWPYERALTERSQPQVERARPGLHRLCVRAPGCVPRSVAVTPTTREEPLEVRLAPAGALRGRVLDAQGQPLANHPLSLTIARESAAWRVPAYHPCAAGGVDAQNRALYEQTFGWQTDAEGRFEWDQLDPALEYTVHFGTRPSPAAARVPRTAAGETRDLGDLRLAPESGAGAPVGAR